MSSSDSNKKITLVALDGESFQLDEAVAKTSEAILSFLDENPSCNEFPAEGDEEELKRYDAEFVKNEGQFMEVLKAATYLGLSDLVSLIGQAIGDTIDGMKSREELCEYFRTVHGINLEEDEEIQEVPPLHFDSDNLFETDILGESHVSVQGPQATTTPQSIISERLNGINFKTWSRSVVHYLTSKGVEGLVDGTYAHPAVTDEKKYTQWKKHNSMVIGWLFNSMDTPIVQMFLYHDFVYDLWSSLKETYSSKSNGSRVFQLYREVHSTSQGDRSAAEYFAQLQTRWEEIDHHEVIVELTGEAAMLVAKRADKQKVFAFLMGLRPEFETLGGQIVNTRPFPSLMNAFATIDDDDRQRSIRQATLPSAAVQGIIDQSALVVDSSYLRGQGQRGRGRGRG
ncbi:hypothetical protein IFM89_015122, partial [Coptis chinensis]